MRQDNVVARTMESTHDVEILLLVDDEEKILLSLKRLFRPLGYSIFTASGGAAALDILAREKIDLVISDMRMPEMDGAHFLKEVAVSWPDTMRILLTGYADLTSTISAVNEGQIYRYVSKPWEDYDLTLAVKQALDNKRLEEEKARLEQITQRQNRELSELNTNLEKKVAARTEELRQTMGFLELANKSLKEQYATSMKVFSNLIEIRGGAMAGHSRRVAEIAGKLAVRMGLSEKESEEIAFAALLHDIGKISLPDDLIEKPYNSLRPEERKRFEKHPVLGQAALMPLEPLQSAAALIRSHHERYDGKGYPDRLRETQIALGARILSVVNDYDALQGGTLADRHYPEQEARRFLTDQGGLRYDPGVVKAFIALLSKGDQETVSQTGEFRLKSSTLKNGMVLARDLVSKTGVLLLSKGHVLDGTLIKMICRFEVEMEGNVEIYVRR